MQFSGNIMMIIYVVLLKMLTIDINKINKARLFLCQVDMVLVLLEPKVLSNINKLLDKIKDILQEVNNVIEKD